MNVNQNPPNNPTSSPHTKKRPIGSYIATVAMFLIVLFLWKDLSSMKADMQELAGKNNELGKEVKTAQTALAAAQTELDFFKTGDVSKSTKEKAARVEPVFTKAVEEPETLFLQTPTVRQTASGLVARFEFKPADTELPEQLTLVVRIPGDSEAKILSIRPVAERGYSSLEVVVNAKGTLGMIEGSPSDLKALSFELTVSEPVKATVRGSKGIKAFEMDISAGGCTVRKL